MLKRRITGCEFKRALKENKIQTSVFAFKSKVEFAKVKQIAESTKPVPELYIQDLKRLYNVDLKPSD